MTETVESAETLRARLILPVSFLNGTNIEAHIDARLNARATIAAVFKALEECKPHTRDYQNDRSGIAYANARAIYSERYSQLDALYNALDDEVEALAAQRR